MKVLLLGVPDYFLTDQMNNKVLQLPVRKQQKTKSTLPKIDIFLTQCYTIPLVHCNFESALKAADTHNKDNVMTTDRTSDPASISGQPITIEATSSLESSKPETRTSSQACTVIDYKKFLEDYADEPPSPPRKKCDVDLKHRPSKHRIAAEKYRSKFTTKPTTYHDRSVARTPANHRPP